MLFKATKKINSVERPTRNELHNERRSEITSLVANAVEEVNEEIEMDTNERAITVSMDKDVSADPDSPVVTLSPRSS